MSIVEEYKLKGNELVVGKHLDGFDITLSMLSDEVIHMELNEIKKHMNQQIAKGWIYIYESEIFKRRIEKIKKLKKSWKVN